MANFKYILSLREVYIQMFPKYFSDSRVLIGHKTFVTCVVRFSDEVMIKSLNALHFFAFTLPSAVFLVQHRHLYLIGQKIQHIFVIGLKLQHVFVIGRKIQHIFLIGSKIQHIFLIGLKP